MLKGFSLDPMDMERKIRYATDVNLRKPFINEAIAFLGARNQLLKYSVTVIIGSFRSDNVDLLQRRRRRRRSYFMFKEANLTRRLICLQVKSLQCIFVYDEVQFLLKSEQLKMDCEDLFLLYDEKCINDEELLT